MSSSQMEKKALEKTGAIAVLDVLGFKGIWKRCEPEKLITKMQRMMEFAQGAARDNKETDLNADWSADYSEFQKFEAKFFSDTVVLAIWCAPKPELEPDRKELLTSCGSLISVKIAGIVCGALYFSALSDAPHIAYRGVIAHGGFTWRDPFFLGPAVDEAAALERLAQGAFIWHAPSALNVLKSAEELRKRVETAGVNKNGLLEWIESPRYFREYEVPLKGGDRLRTSVIVPVFDNPADFSHVRDTMLNNIPKAFDSSELDVVMKRQNTCDFLNSLRSE